jgi:hypothetical protein
MENNNFEVAITKTACPICTKQEDGDLVLNKRLNRYSAAQVKKLHGQVVDWKICNECEEAKNKGAFFLVEIDPSKSEITDGKISPEGAYRTGRIWGIKREAVSRIFGKPITDKDLIAFIDPETAAKIGLTSPTESEQAINNEHAN